MRNLPLKLKLFFICVYTITLGSIISFISFNIIPANITNFSNLIFFSALLALTETFSVSYANISFSTSFALTTLVFIIVGPFSAILITIIGFSFRVLKTDKKYKHILNTPFYGTLFNYCILVLPLLYASYLFKYLGGHNGISEVPNNILPTIIFAVTFFLINAFIISMLYSITTNNNLIYSFITNFRLGILNIIVMTPFGIILAIIFDTYKYWGVLLFLFPVVLVRYTFSLYIESKSKYVKVIDVLMHAMEARDEYTQGHTKRVGELAKRIAVELRYSQWKIEELYVAALLHDVGKIGISDAILNKPGKLTEEEFNIIKQHPEIGYNIIKDLKDGEKINFIVRHHHERYDGNGYPDGKKPEELNLDVFIVQLADSIDAMETDRPYRKALTKENIIKEVTENRGTQFHPTVVDAYLRIIKKQESSE